MLNSFIKLTVRRLYRKGYTEISDKYYSVYNYSIKEAVADCVNDEKIYDEIEPHCLVYTISCDGVTLYNSLTRRIER